VSALRRPAHKQPTQRAFEVRQSGGEHLEQSAKRCKNAPRHLRKSKFISSAVRHQPQFLNCLVASFCLCCHPRMRAPSHHHDECTKDSTARTNRSRTRGMACTQAVVDFDPCFISHVSSSATFGSHTAPAAERVARRPEVTHTESPNRRTHPRRFFLHFNSVITHL
jgi:hypothetical protein